MQYPLISLALFGLTISLQADVVPASLFTDNAVLQRDKPVPIWGIADAGEKIDVSFSGQTLSTNADSAGKWRVSLAAMPARPEGAQLIIKGNNTITLSNIVVGEVWIASGQSNMEWPLKLTNDASADIPAANFPQIRHIKIAKKVEDAPAFAASGVWQVASPGSVATFTAVGYYFARDIHQTLNVPVGIISSNWGGTPIESWMNSEAYALVPNEAEKVKARWKDRLATYPEKKAQFDADLATWEKEQATAKSAGTSFTKRRPAAPWGPGHPGTPSGLYNAMIHPLVPYSIRGAIWYQGEANAGRAAEYQALFPAMIRGWRAAFGQGDFPFYWVQLSNFGSPTETTWAFLREAQAKTLSVPNTGQAVSIDIGNAQDIHPRNKKEVGRRLARLALAHNYGFKVITSGPVMKRAERVGTSFKVTFTELGGGLTAPLNELSGFELAGEDKVFKPASAKVEDEGSVLVSSAEVPAPIAIRYAWRNAPEAGLFNREGLPAVPFRSDSW